MTPMNQEDYAANINAVIASARNMRAADPSRPSREWFNAKFDPDRVLENQSLYTFARSLGFDLAAVAEPPAEAPAADTAPPKASPAFSHRNASEMDWNNIPCTPWLHGQRLVRGHVSVLTGTGGVGKTAMTTAVACSMALGRNLVDPANQDPRWRLHENAPARVFLYNLEDDFAEFMRRIKALLNHHDLGPGDLGEMLEMGDGTAQRLVVAIADKRNGVVQRQACVDDLIEWLRATSIDVVVLDPLVKAHKCEENSNDAMDEVMVLLKEVAIRANVAVWLVHHSGKAGTTVDSTGSRGATAIVGAPRVCETMTRPTAEEKAKFGLEANVVRLDSTKANLSAANENTMWLRLDGVAVGNPSAVFPMGDFRQVMTLIQPQGISERMERASFDAVCAELRKLPPKKVWAKAKQNKDTIWVGVPFMAAGYPEAAAKLLVKEWASSGLLRQIEVTHEADRRKYWGLRLDEITAKKRGDSIL